MSSKRLLSHRHEIEMTPQSRYSCVTCARRKVKCDKLSPCSTCSKAQIACTYRDPVPSQRHRKRATQRDLLHKIQELESILHNNKIPFEALDNSWISSQWEERLAQGPQTQPGSIETATRAGVSPQAHFAENLDQTTDDLLSEQAIAARLWSELPEVVRVLLLVEHSSLTNCVSSLKLRQDCNSDSQTRRQGRSPLTMMTIWRNPFSLYLLLLPQLEDS